MKFEQLVTAVILGELTDTDRNPRGFRGRKYSIARRDAMNHIFNVIGNGYGWHEETGQLVYCDCAEHEKWTGEEYSCSGKLNERIPEIVLNDENYMDIMDEKFNYRAVLEEVDGMNLLEELEEALEEADSDESREFYKMLIRSTKTMEDFKPYCPTSGGLIHRLPDNIDDSFLTGAEEMAKMLREHYEDENSTDLHKLAGIQRENRMVECLKVIDKLDKRIEELKEVRVS